MAVSTGAAILGAAGAGLVGSIFGSDAQSDAAGSASNAQQAAAMYAAQLQKQSSDDALSFQRAMWRKSQKYFQPYFNAGALGLNDLRRNISSFYDETVAPLAQQYYGLEAPTLPEFQYQFDTEDPVYQQKLSELNESVDKFLAKQGLQGSSAGEAFRQKQMQTLLAGEEQRQYGRATDTYNRDLSSTLTQDQLQRQLLLSKYGVAGDQYNTKYAGALDLAKMGAGAAGTAGQTASSTGANLANTAMATGQGLANTALYSGNAAAQGQLAAGQAQAGMWQGIGNMGMGLGSLAMQYGGGYQTPQLVAYNQPYGYGGYTSGGTLPGPYM